MRAKHRGSSTNESGELCLQPVQGSDVVQGGDTGREPAVEAEDGALHHGGEGEEVEGVGEETPDLGDISSILIGQDITLMISHWSKVEQC